MVRPVKCLPKILIKFQEQKYQLLEKADPDVKTSASSEKKEEENWDNDWQTNPRNPMSQILEILNP